MAAKTQHWGDVRARLELAIEAVLEKIARLRSVRSRCQLKNDPPGAPPIASQSSSPASTVSSKKTSIDKTESQEEDSPTDKPVTTNCYRSDKQDVSK